jgi:hypothetical protein
LGLQPLQVHQGAAAVVVPLHLDHAGAVDPEERHAPSVRAAHLDAGQLAAAHQPEGREIDVFGQEHALTSFSPLWIGEEEISYSGYASRGSPLLAGPAPGVLPRSIPTSVRFFVLPAYASKTAGSGNTVKRENRYS